MRILVFIGAAVVALVAAFATLDAVGGYIFDGPAGPLGVIPGGRMSGEVDPTPSPDWTKNPKMIELEIRPEKPWSLTVYNVVVDGELYIPSLRGAERRWPPVALADPRVRVRIDGTTIYERKIVKVEDPALRARVARAITERYGNEKPEDPGEDDTWYFHLAARD